MVICQGLDGPYYMSLNNCSFYERQPMWQKTHQNAIIFWLLGRKVLVSFSPGIQQFTHILIRYLKKFKWNHSVASLPLVDKKWQSFGVLTRFCPLTWVVASAYFYTNRSNKGSIANQIVPLKMCKYIYLGSDDCIVV